MVVQFITAMQMVTKLAVKKRAFSIFFLIMGCVAQPACAGEDVTPEAFQLKTYQIFVNSIEADDLVTFQSYLIPQEGLDFETVENLWAERAKAIFQDIYPPLENMTLVKRFSVAQCDYWITELNEPWDGSMQLKAYKFYPVNATHTGYRVGATPDFASYKLSEDIHSARDGIIKKLSEAIQARPCDF